jgi:hypothetical protein
MFYSDPVDMRKSIDSLCVITLQQQEIISYKERYTRLLEEFKLEKSRLYSSSSKKNVLQAGLFDEPDIELDAELKDQLDDAIDIQVISEKNILLEDQSPPIFLVKSSFMILVMRKKYVDVDRHLSLLEKRSVSKSNIYLQP